MIHRFSIQCDSNDCDNELSDGKIFDDEDQAEVEASRDLIVDKDQYGNLWVKQDEEVVLVWYSYGRVYTVVNGEESTPQPEDAGVIARAFLAIENYLKEAR